MRFIKIIRNTRQRGKKYVYRDCRGGRDITITIGTSKLTADDYLKHKEAQEALGPLGVPVQKRTQFKEFVKIYQHNCNPEKTESTLSRDFYTLNHLLPVFGESYLDRIKPTEIVDYRNTRLEAVSKTTVNREISLLKVILKRAVEWGYIGSSPAETVKPYKLDEPEQKYLTAPQVSALLEAADDTTRRFIVVAVSTGLRKTEIWNLKWEDVDFEKGHIRARTKGRKYRYLHLGSPGDLLYDTLMDSRERTGYVFPGETPTGQRCDIRWSFKKALKKAGLPRIRIHDLRHTYGSNLVMAGVDISTVAKLMGHEDIRTTMRYSHLSPGHLQEASQKLPWRVKIDH